MPKYIASLDQGTSSTRCMIFDSHGRVISFASRQHRQITPQPGWVEHDPTEILDNAEWAISTALGQADLVPDDLAALGVTNQRETIVAWNRLTGKPMYTAISWQDTRTARICEQLAGERGTNRFRTKTGLPIATYFSGPKITWLFNNYPLLEKAVADGDLICGTIDSWLIWNFSGGSKGGMHITDVTNASRTSLMNINTLDWDEELLDAMAVPRGVLPEIHSSSEIYAEAKGALAGVPLASAIGDQQAALLGQACFDKGEIKATYGTGLFILMNTGEEPNWSDQGLLTTLAYRIGSQPAVYCLEGSVPAAGASISWLRDNLGLVSTSKELDELAESVNDNGGVYFVPAFSGLFAPYWDPQARGLIAGLTGYANKGHIARATLEAAAFQTQKLISAIEQDSNTDIATLKVDGGMANSNLAMQILANISDIDVVRPSNLETTSLGAAFAAGLAVGFWDSFDELSSHWEEGERFEPRIDSETRERYLRFWEKAVTRSMAWLE